MHAWTVPLAISPFPGNSFPPTGVTYFDSLIKNDGKAVRYRAWRAQGAPSDGARWIFLGKRNERFPLKVALTRHCLSLCSAVVSISRFYVIATYGRRTLVARPVTNRSISWCHALKSLSARLMTLKLCLINGPLFFPFSNGRSCYRSIDSSAVDAGHPLWIPRMFSWNTVFLALRSFQLVWLLRRPAACGNGYNCSFLGHRVEIRLRVAVAIFRKV